MKMLSLFAVAAIVAPCAAVGQTYPVPKLFDRTIDACIDSNLFPRSESKQCSHGAQQLIANTFCLHQNRPRAVTWDSAFTGEFQSSWQLYIRRSATGEDGKWVPFDKGGAIFTSITCENGLSDKAAKIQTKDADGSIHINVVINNTQNQDQKQDQKQDQDQK
jgi:hypothetical protein